MTVGEIIATEKGFEKVLKVGDYGDCITGLLIPKETVIEGYNRWIKAPVKEQTTVELSELKEGIAIEVGGIQMEILDICYPSANDGGGVLCLAKDILFPKAFDEDDRNNWATSSLRKYLNGEYLREVESKIGEYLREVESKIGDDALMSFKRDLMPNDGMKDYCKDKCIDKISLISCDEYKTYRDNISTKTKWRTLTPWTCHPGYSNRVRFATIGGSLNYNDTCTFSGIALQFLLKPGLEVKVIGGKEG